MYSFYLRMFRYILFNEMCVQVSQSSARHIATTHQSDGPELQVGAAQRLTQWQCSQLLQCSGRGKLAGSVLALSMWRENWHKSLHWTWIHIN